MTDRRQFILCAAASAIGCTARAGDGAVAHDAAKPRFYFSGHQHRLAVRGYKNLVILGAEATCDNFDIRPQGFRMFEVNDDFSYSWNFVEV